MHHKEFSKDLLLGDPGTPHICVGRWQQVVHRLVPGDTREQLKRCVSKAHRPTDQADRARCRQTATTLLWVCLIFFCRAGESRPVELEERLSGRGVHCGGADGPGFDLEHQGGGRRAGLALGGLGLGGLGLVLLALRGEGSEAYLQKMCVNTPIPAR